MRSQLHVILRELKFQMISNFKVLVGRRIFHWRVQKQFIRKLFRVEFQLNVSKTNEASVKGMTVFPRYNHALPASKFANTRCKEERIIRSQWITKYWRPLSIIVVGRKQRDCIERILRPKIPVEKNRTYSFRLSKTAHVKIVSRIPCDESSVKTMIRENREKTGKRNVCVCDG